MFTIQCVIFIHIIICLPFNVLFLLIKYMFTVQCVIFIHIIICLPFNVVFSDDLPSDTLFVGRPSKSDKKNNNIYPYKTEAKGRLKQSS